MRYTHEKLGELNMRLDVGEICKPLLDIRDSHYKSLHDPDDYTCSQPLITVTVRKTPGGLSITALETMAHSALQPLDHLQSQDQHPQNILLTSGMEKTSRMY